MWHAPNPSHIHVLPRAPVSRIAPLTSHVLPHRSDVSLDVVVDDTSTTCAAARTGAREQQDAGSGAAVRR